MALLPVSIFRQEWPPSAVIWHRPLFAGCVADIFVEESDRPECAWTDAERDLACRGRFGLAEAFAVQSEFGSLKGGGKLRRRRAGDRGFCRS